jgi:hypothetical protein
VAVDAQLGVEREVAAELEEERAEVSVHRVDLVGPVDIHLNQTMAPAKHSMAANDVAVFS